MDRATYLTMSGYRLLDDWGANLRRMFGEVPYLVGSALTTADHRDVDVRLLLDREPWDQLDAAVYLPDLHLCVSLWGQRVTGLPIDFQVQLVEDANAQFHGRRHPLGLTTGPGEDT